MSDEQKTFDPAKYLTKVGSADYLEVKWRLVWLRETNPDATIKTVLHSHENNEAVFSAEVTIPGGGSATGWGSEASDDFRDYLEKAETKAIGRALAALGFGTQFCPDHDFGAAHGRIVDSPISFDSNRGRSMAQPSGGGSGGGGYSGQQASATEAATPRQLKFMEAIARESGLSDEDMLSEIHEKYGKNPQQLSRREASNYIDGLQSKQVSRDLSS